MPSYVTPKKNSEYIFYVSLTSQADTKLHQANPTLAAGDVKVATDDAAPANLTTLPAVDADFTDRVKVTVSASEMNGDNVTVIFSDAAGSEWCDLTVNIQTTARQVDDLAYPTTTGRSIDVTTTGEVGLDLDNTSGTLDAAQIGSNAITADKIATDAITAAKIAADAIGASELATDAVNEIVDQVWDEAQADHVAAGSFGVIATEIADILTDTGTTLDGKIDTIDTNVDSILVDTGTTLDNHLTDIKGTGFVKDTHSLVDIETYVDLIDDGTSGLAKIATDVAAILVDTNSLNDTKIPDTISLANINAEVDTAMVTYGLDHLVQTSVVGADIADNSIIAYLASSSATADWDDYVNTTDSLQANRDKLTDIETDTAEIGSAGAGLTAVSRAINPQQNQAFSDVEFEMYDTTNHNPATGKTVTGERSIDGGAYTSVSGTIAEVGSGTYQFDAAAADMNGAMITFRFSNADCDDTFVHVKTSA